MVDQRDLFCLQGPFRLMGEAADREQEYENNCGKEPFDRDGP